MLRRQDDQRPEILSEVRVGIWGAGGAREVKVTRAIELLQSILKRAGDVEVYFDCPHCLQAFTPGTVETKAVVLNGKRSSEETTR